MRRLRNRVEASQNANGNTLDRQGRLVTAEHSGRRVSRLEEDGGLVTVVDRFDGKKLNSPNESKLYVADSGTPRHIRVFDVAKNGVVGDGRVFAVVEQGVPAMREAAAMASPLTSARQCFCGK